MRRFVRALTALVVLSFTPSGEAKTCVATETSEAPLVAQLADLELQIERLQTRVPALQEASETATTAYEALARQSGSDPKLVDEIAKARATAEAKRLVWEEAKELLKCLELQRDASWVNHVLAEGGGHHLSLAPSLAGGAGGVSRVGGSVLYSVQSSSSQAFEAGVGVDRLWEVSTDAERSAADGRGREVVLLGLRSRVYFGGLRTSLFLGLHPDVVLRPKADWNGRPGARQLSLSGQVGVRVRTLGDVPVSMRFFLEPRAILDGTTPVSLLFGVELSLGLRVRRNGVTMTRYDFK
ncbi:MAG: hypothetical protein KF782_04710 [Labilithrix sp.]|nr:hypothetical protein [Labilithrix sp.]